MTSLSLWRQEEDKDPDLSHQQDFLISFVFAYFSVSTFLWQQEEGKDPALVSHQPESFYFWNFGIFICVFVFWGEQGPCVFISDLEFVFAYFYS